MQNYTMVSEDVMRELLTAKSKMNDVREYAHEYAKALQAVHAYLPLLNILNGAYYGTARKGDEE